MTQRSFSNPSQHAWNVALQDIQAAQKADEVYNKVRLAIEQHTSLLKRDAEVRVKVWMTKLSEQTNNPVWKKNRNAYAKLLLHQLKQGQLREPFNAAPPQGPLQTLPASLTYASSIARTGSIRSTSKSGMSVCSSEGSPPRQGGTVSNLEDYQGRHSSSLPHRIASAGTANLNDEAQNSQHGASDTDCTDTQQDTQHGQHAQRLQRPQRQSSLWGAESLGGRALSKTVTMQSQDSAKRCTDASREPRQAAAPGLARSKSSSSQQPVQEGQAAPRRQQSAVSWTEAQLQASHQPQTGTARSPVSRHPSRLQQCGSPALSKTQPQDASARSAGDTSSSDDSSIDQEQVQHHTRHQHRHQQQTMQPLQSAGARASPRSPMTAQDYMRRAGYCTQQQRSAEVQTRQSQHMGQQHKSPVRSPPYAAKARILDLHDGCTLADAEQTLSSGRAVGCSPARGGRRDGQGGAGVCLGGTNMKLASRGSNRGGQRRSCDAIDLADESWQPSKLELQARLGASKERQLELEWRLQQAEQKVAQAQARQTSAEIQLQEADQLRLLGKQQQQAADQPRSRRMKKDLGKLIEKYEKKQYRWGSPTKAAFLAHLTPLDAYRDSSSLSSSDSFAEISAALQSHCRLGSDLDLDLLTQQPNTSQGISEQDKHQQQSFPRHTRQHSQSVSGGSSELSVESALDQQHSALMGDLTERLQHNGSQQHPQEQQQQQESNLAGINHLHASKGSAGDLSRPAGVASESTSFMQRLQDFKRGTNALRRQVYVK